MINCKETKRKLNLNVHLALSSTHDESTTKSLSAWTTVMRDVMSQNCVAAYVLIRNEYVLAAVNMEFAFTNWPPNFERLYIREKIFFAPGAIQYDLIYRF